MHQIGYGFYWSIKKWSELRQKYFWFILWAFLFMSSCTLWVTLQDFAKWKTLRYIFVISFISIAFGGGEIKIFQTFLDWFSIHETLSWVFWALSPQNIVQFCWNFDQRWSPISVWKDSVWKILQNFEFNSNGRHRKFTVLFHFGAQFTAGKPKILLKTKVSAKTTFLGISNSISPRSQKNYRILGKLSTKIFGGSKLVLNCPLWPCQRVIKISHLVYNSNIPLHVLDAKFQVQCICGSPFYLEEALCFLVQDPSGPILRVLGTITPVSNNRLSWNSDHG